MPFDGNLDYADMMNRIRRTNYAGTLMLEIVQEGEYLGKSHEEFLRIAYERIQHISEMK